MRAHAGRDHDIEAGRPGGARHRQTVRAEVPILGDEKEQLWPPRRAGGRGPWRQVQRFCDNGQGHVETPEGGIGTEDLSNASASGSVGQSARRSRPRVALGAHPGDRCSRLHRPRAVRRPRRARPCRARAVPASGGANPGRRASPDRRYRPDDRLVGASRPYRHRRASRQPRAPSGAGGSRSERGAGRAGPGALCGKGRGAPADPYELGPGDGRGDAAGSAVSRDRPAAPARSLWPRQARDRARPAGGGAGNRDRTSSFCVRRSSTVPE